MSGYADMSELFEGAGLGIPPVPEEIRPEVREICALEHSVFVGVSHPFILRRRTGRALRGTS